jgi:hypothetical protein
MPGMDGWEATRRLRAIPENATIRILALTAHAMRGDREKAIEAGCDDVLTKPYRPSELIEAMKRVLASPPRRIGDGPTGPGRGPTGLSAGPHTNVPGNGHQGAGVAVSPLLEFCHREPVPLPSRSAIRSGNGPSIPRRPGLTRGAGTSGRFFVSSPRLLSRSAKPLPSSFRRRLCGPPIDVDLPSPIRDYRLCIAAQRPSSARTSPDRGGRFDSSYGRILEPPAVDALPAPRHKRPKRGVVRQAPTPTWSPTMSHPRISRTSNAPRHKNEP